MNELLYKWYELYNYYQFDLHPAMMFVCCSYLLLFSALNIRIYPEIQVFKFEIQCKKVRFQMQIFKNIFKSNYLGLGFGLEVGVRFQIGYIENWQGIWISNRSL